MKNEMQLDNVDISFTYHKPSGEEVVIKASIGENGYWQQWGATKSELGDNVSLIEEITAVVNQYLVTE